MEVDGPKTANPKSKSNYSSVQVKRLGKNQCFDPNAEVGEGLLPAREEWRSVTVSTGPQQLEGVLHCSMF